VSGRSRKKLVVISSSEATRRRMASLLSSYPSSASSFEMSEYGMRGSFAKIARMRLSISSIVVESDVGDMPGGNYRALINPSGTGALRDRDTIRGCTHPVHESVGRDRRGR
jgi:hypothetical protein